MFWYFLYAIILAILTVSGFYFSDLIIHPKTLSRERTLQTECENGNMSREAFDCLIKEEVRISSRYGYDLYGLYFPNGNSKKTVIICHGITVNIYTSVKYMDLFMKRGFNVLLYEHRNHGKSGGDNTTFGYYEKYDLKSCIDWVIERRGHDSVIGVHGESMGAAIALQSLTTDSRISFCIADCPFSDLSKLLKYRLKVEYKLPSFPAIQITSLFVWLRTGMKLKDVSPIRDVSKTEIPILFVHGKEDLYIPAQMSIDMYNSNNGIKKLYLAPNARHAEALPKNRNEYDSLVGDFLNEVIG